MSPGKAPDLCNSAVAVIVFSANDVVVLRASPLRMLAVFCDSLTALKLWLLVLRRLEPLISLGAGLSGSVVS